MPKLIYILAASHSGSTLTALLLGSHDDVSTAGELKMSSFGDPDKYLCSCKSKVSDCLFWGDVESGMIRRGMDFSIRHPNTHFAARKGSFVSQILKPLYRGGFLEQLRTALLACSPSWRKLFRVVQLQNQRLVATLAEVSQSKFVVDSSKIGLRLHFLLKNKDLDIYVVHLVRDGRAVTLAYVDPESYADALDPSLRGGGYGASRDSEIKSVRIAAREWRRSNEEAEVILRAIPSNRQVKIRYEDLCESPTKTLNKVFQMLGLEVIDSIKDFRNKNEHIIGNGMRFDSGSDIRLDDRWKNEFTVQQLREFDDVAGGLNRKLRYQ